jgi:predicted O-methyltransferase YrrM
MAKEPERATGVSMTYAEFHKRFGGSYRTKHLALEPGDTLLMEDGFCRRSYSLPPATPLSKEFIRLDPWEGEYLFMLASRARRRIVEIGRLHGGSTFLMACANGDAPILSIDLGPKNDAWLRACLEEHDIGANVELVIGDSQKGDFPGATDIDLLFIDGDHSFQGCLNDLEQWFPRVAPGGHVLLHDCYFGNAVQDAALAFASRQPVDWVRSPHIIASHWHTSSGSLAHFVKRA